MKHRVYIVLSFLYTTILNTAYAQGIESYKKVQLGGTETLILNSVGGTTLSLGGKQTRNRLLEDIPLMTDFIIINVEVDNSSAVNDIRTNQEMMTALMESKSGPETKLIGGATLMALSPPTTGYKCDFFMFPDRQNYNAYMEPGLIMNYADNYVSYSDPYRKMNTESFNLVVDVSKLQDKNQLFLGFRNNDNLNAIKVFVNVFALVGNGWTKPIKDEAYKKIYESLKDEGITNEEILTNTANCLLSNLTSKYTTTEFANMPEYEQKKVGDDLMKICNPDLVGSEEKNKAITYGNLGWKAFENGDYDKCICYSEKAISIDNTLVYVYFNIALVHLVKNQADALDKYIDAIQMAKKHVNTKETLQAAIDDIANYENTKGILANSADVKDVLNAELK